MKTLLTPPAKMNIFFFLKKKEKSTPPLRDTVRTYKGCTYLLCVNSMPGYFEDHNTTERLRKAANIIWAKSKETMTR